MGELDPQQFDEGVKRGHRLFALMQHYQDLSKLTPEEIALVLGLKGKALQHFIDIGQAELATNRDPWPYADDDTTGQHPVLPVDK